MIGNFEEKSKVYRDDENNMNSETITKESIRKLVRVTKLSNGMRTFKIILRW